jgi:EAL domain-containing protein (putative c-di-GMP-specific phosphodiesterase class I)
MDTTAATAAMEKDDPMRLLIVDDEADMAGMVAAVAVRAGWLADTTHDSAGFKTAYAGAVPDAVIIDLHLGAADGIELLRFLADEKFTGRVALMSGFDDRVLRAAEEIARLLGLKIAGVMRKPARIADIRTLLDRIKGEAEPLTPAHLSQAMDAGHMRFHYQPIAAVHGLATVKVEALARWNDPTRGYVPPAEFVRVMESDGALMDRFTLWAVESALAGTASMKAAGRRLPVAVNVSAVNLTSLDFPDRVAELARRYDVEPGSLVLEITETAATSDPAVTMDILTRLRLKGFGLAIDDFGTGYSSLVALHRLPFSEIKIDKSFVDEVPDHKEAASIVKTVCDLARNLNLTCVAEGVETASAAQALQELGVDLFQGFYLSPPLPQEELERWLDR